MKKAGLAVAVVIGLYLIGRAAVEIATVHYGDPASYALDWGGPSLAGVLAVHCGPGLLALGLFGWWVGRRVSARRAGPPRTPGSRPA
jgi:hypothetical protein